ncbi:MAG: hypothetical protein LBH26_02715 [Treponema sp.]|jgi:hypothetical protein|nr:hypothetical protein [Treponema sp.]
MRKFFIILLVLLAAGGAAFFFGWAQLGVPPDSYGIMRSKTHGLDPRLIREGEFRWVWYKLIPTNVTIDVYKPGRVNRQLKFQGSLPSGELYTAFAASTGVPEIRLDFSYEVSIDLAFSLKADSLVSLVRENNISGQAELEAFEENLARDIGAFVLRWLNNPDSSREEIPALLASGYSPRLEGEISGRFPYIENLSCRIGADRFPDFRLYRQLQGLYEEYVAKQREYLSGSSEGSPEKRIDSRFRLDELARYGELLTKYPVLLEYLNLEQNR